MYSRAYKLFSGNSSSSSTFILTYWGHCKSSFTCFLKSTSDPVQGVSSRNKTFQDNFFCQKCKSDTCTSLHKVLKIMKSKCTIQRNLTDSYSEENAEQKTLVAKCINKGNWLQLFWKLGANKFIRLKNSSRQLKLLYMPTKNI